MFANRRSINMESCSSASMATGRTAFFGSKPAVALPTRRQAMHFRRRCNTQAILEKAREIVSPSNGASSSSRPSTDPSSVQADVLQNLGKNVYMICAAVMAKSMQIHNYLFGSEQFLGTVLLAQNMLLGLHQTRSPTAWMQSLSTVESLQALGSISSIDSIAHKTIGGEILTGVIARETRASIW